MYKPNCSGRKHSKWLGASLRTLLICALFFGSLLTVLSGAFLSVANASAHATSSIRPLTGRVLPHKFMLPRKRSSLIGPDAVLTLVPDTTTHNVGDLVTYTATVTNAADAANSIPAGVPITVTDLVPLGLSNVQTNNTVGSVWSFALSGLTGGSSPATIVATYLPTSDVLPGTTLPPFTISGILTPDALGTFVNDATASVAGDLNLVNNVASTLISVLPIVPTLIPTLTVPVPTLTVPVPTLTVPVPTLTVPVPTLTVPVPTLTVPVPTLTVPVPTLTIPVPTLTVPVPTLTVPVPTLDRSGSYLTPFLTQRLLLLPIRRHPLLLQHQQRSLPPHLLLPAQIWVSWRALLVVTGS